MNDAAFNEIRAQMDAELSGAPKNVGILFGEELFAEFAARGLITPEHPRALGIMPLAFDLPAYNGSYLALLYPSCKPTEYQLQARSPTSTPVH